MTISTSSDAEKTNPIQTQSPKSQNEAKLLFNKGLQKSAVPPPTDKTNPIKTNSNPIFETYGL